MKKLILLTLILLSALLLLTSCFGLVRPSGKEECAEHVDRDYNAECDVCGSYVKHEHVFGDEFVYTEDFHYRPTICHDTNYAKDKGKHTFETRVITEPTCAEYGVEEDYCTVCGYVKRTRTVGKLPHTHDGVLHFDGDNHWYNYTCGCEIDKTPHLWSVGEVKTPATCTSEGIKVYHCLASDCDAVREESLEIIPHTVSEKPVHDGEYHWHEYLCGCHELEEKTPHELVGYRVTKQPTCTEEGEYLKSCKGCSYIFTGSLPVIDHTYSEDLTADRECHWYAASCGCDLKKDKTPHSFDITNKCTVCGYQLLANDGFIYTLSADYTEYYLSGIYDTAMTVLDIPAISLGKPVTKILAGALVGADATSLKIPGSVTEIEAGALSGLNLTGITVDPASLRYSSLGGVLVDKQTSTLLLASDSPETYIPSGVAVISPDAFRGFTAITSITLPNTVISIGEYAFSGTAMEILWQDGATVTEISPYAFAEWQGAEMTLPPSVITVRENAFSDSTANILLNEGLLTVEKHAFLGCVGITSLYLPSSLLSVGGGAFSGCSSITDVSLPFVGESPTAEKSASLLGYIFGTEEYEGSIKTSQSYYSFYSTSYYLPAGLKSATVRSGVIGTGAFHNVTTLTELTVLDGTSEIMNGALRGCTSIEKITLPFIGRRADLDEDSSESVFGHIFGTAYEGTYQSYANTKGGYYEIPSSVRDITVTGGNIRYGAFSNCRYVEKITLPESVTAFPPYLFSHCAALVDVNIPDGVTEIGLRAFQGSGIREFHVPTSLKMIDLYAFTDTSVERVYVDSLDIWCGITLNQYKATPLHASGAKLYVGGAEISGEVVIPSGVTRIEYGAFMGADKITSLKLPESVTEISDYAFFGCTSLHSVHFSSGVTGIGSYAFSGSDIKELRLSDGLLSIGRGAFSDSKRLLTVRLPESLTSLALDSFLGCTKLAEVYNFSALSDENIKSNCISDYAYVIHTEDVESALTVDAEGFVFINGGSSLYLVDYVGENKSITLPSTYNGKSYIMGVGVFRGLGITFFDANGAVTAIGDYALSGSDITEARLTGVTEIGEGAFSGCPSLTRVTLDPKLEVLGEAAFSDCTALPSLSLAETKVTSIPPSLFKGCTSLTSLTLKVTNSAIGDEALADCTALTSISNLNYTKAFGSYAFRGCVSLTSLHLYTVETVGERAFFGCTALENIHFSSLRTVSKEAFLGCTALTSVTLSSKLGVTVGEAAFRGCTALKSVDMKEFTVADYGFSCCTALVLTENNTLLSVGFEAFADCTALDKIVFSKSVTSGIEIGEGAFRSSGIRSITITPAVSTLGVGALESCLYLKEVYYGADIRAFADDNLVFADAGTLGDGIILTVTANTSYIPESFFYPTTDTEAPRTPKLVSIVFESPGAYSDVSIGNYAFKNCTYLEKFELPRGLSSLGINAFIGCTSVKLIDYYSEGNFTLDYTIKEWGDNESVTNPFNLVGSATDGVTFVVKPSALKIPGGMFYSSDINGANIKEVIFEEGSSLTEIGDYAFWYMKITTLRFPSKLKTIGDCAFCCCFDLEEAYVPSSVTYIGSNAFEGDGTLYFTASSKGDWSPSWDNIFHGTKVWGYREDEVT